MKNTKSLTSVILAVSRSNGKENRMDSQSRSFVSHKCFWLFALTVFFLGMTSPVAATTIQLYPDADTFISSNYPDNNYGGSTALLVGKPSSGGNRQARIRFSGIPSGATINSATLRLYRYTGNGAFTLAVQSASRSWSENTLTYNTDGSTNRWTTPKSTYYMSDITGYLSVDVTTHVQEWADGTRSNYGFHLSTNEPWNVDPGNDRGFYSREYSSTSYRPRLEIVYTSQYADLQLLNMTVSRSSNTARTFTACSFDIKNNGPAALSSEGIMVDYYLSNDTVFGDSDDRKIGDTGFTVSIASGATYHINLSSTGLGHMVDLWTQCLVPNGNYYVFAKVRITSPPPTDPTSGNDYDRTNSTITYTGCPTVSLLEAVDASGFSAITTGTSARWFGQTTTYYYDGDAAQSADIDDGGESYMYITVTGPGTIKFYWKVSSEANYDYLEFYDGSTRLARISGTVDWGPEKVFSIESGSHTLKWRYVKDGSVSSGSDCGWVDYVRWVVTPDEADLALLNLTVSRPSDTTARTFTACSFDIKNNGPAALSSESLMVDYYLSNDTTFGDADDRKIGDTGFTLSIASGATYHINLSSTGLNYMVDEWTQCLVPNGNYYVFAQVRITSPPPSDPTSSNNYDRTDSTFTYSGCGYPDIRIEPNLLEFEYSPSSGSSAASYDREPLQVERFMESSVNEQVQLPAYDGPQQSKTGPTPPPGVPEKIPEMGILAEVALSSVPPYSWRHGCGPTAVGMVVGYYDSQGYNDLITGDAATQTDEVNQAIASGGTSGSPYPSGSEQHYEDYSRPEDPLPGAMQTDDYITQARIPHSDNCIGDYMDTSKSTRNNRYGWSWSSDVGPSFVSYVNQQNSSYNPTYQQYQMGSTLTWNILTTEIANGRPMVFLVDTDADGGTDHFVTVVGYRDTPSQQYGCLDTWAPADVVRWCDFAQMSGGQPWGIWGGWSFSLAPLSEDSFTIYNDGTADLEVNSISKRDGDAWLASWAPDAPFTIVPGGSQTVVVNIDGALGAPGLNEEQLIVLSNDDDKNPYPDGVYVNLTVTCDPPVIIDDPDDQTVCEGGSVTFNVTATGTAPLSYQWRKDGSNILGATASSYTIDPVTAADAGSYDCVVTNSCGSATSNGATLTVNSGPVISQHPQDVAVFVGQDAVFTVVATGSEPLHYQWKKNGSNVGEDSPILTLYSVQLSDSGSVITCEVSNACGTVASDPAVLTVNPLLYTVTASAGPHGTIDPNGPVDVNYGADQLFTATPDTGYSVDQWYLDTNSIQVGGTTYTLENIQSSHTVEVTFRSNPTTYVTTAYGEWAGTDTVQNGPAYVRGWVANTGYQESEVTVDDSSVPFQIEATIHLYGVDGEWDAPPDYPQESCGQATGTVTGRFTPSKYAAGTSMYVALDVTVSGSPVGDAEDYYLKLFRSGSLIAEVNPQSGTRTAIVQAGEELTFEMFALEDDFTPNAWQTSYNRNFNLVCSEGGRILYVDDNSPNDPGTGTPEDPYRHIQDGIDTAIDGVTIIVVEGTYYENINFNDKNIILTSIDPNDSNIVANTVIDGNDNGSVVTFAGTEDPNCLLTGFTITNGSGTESGYAYYGGGVYGGGTRATVSKCLITGNSAGDWDSFGGGVYDCDGLITDCNISNNTSYGGGGGLAYCDGEIKGCTVSGNVCTSGSDPWGAGLYRCNGNIRNCRITANTCPAAEANGGGLAYCNGSIINCEITDNSVGGWAGGLGFCDGNIINCQVSGNVSGGAGAGLYYCDANIVNCVVYDNTNAGWWFEPGGGLYRCDGQIINCTIVANVAECDDWGCGSAGYGGGLHGCNGKISNCIIWGNIAEVDGDQLYSSSDPNYSCIQDWIGGGIGNISVDPCFADPCHGDYHLLPKSLCIDSGDPNYVADANEVDIDGDARIIGGRIDIGADEYSYGELCDLYRDGIVNFKDFGILAYYWMDYLCSEPDWCEGSDLDESRYVDFGDLKTFAENWLWQAIWYSQ